MLPSGIAHLTTVVHTQRPGGAGGWCAGAGHGAELLMLISVILRFSRNMTKQSQIMKSATFLLFTAGFQGANFAPTVTALIELHVCGWGLTPRVIDWYVVHRLEGPEALYYSGSVTAQSQMVEERLCRTSSCHFWRETLGDGRRPHSLSPTWQIFTIPASTCHRTVALWMTSKLVELL